MNALLVPLFALSALSSTAGAISIQNHLLAVVFDEVSGAIEVTSATTAQPFATGGKLDGKADRATILETNHPVFGAGRAIRVELVDGSVTTLSLHAELPFLLVSKTQRNGAGQAADFQTVEPISFDLRLGQPAVALRTMGTGGLLAPAENPGSYLFLACADPATRAGVVAGWITQNKGSGTVFSPVSGGAVGLKARLEHGHMILPPGKSAELDSFAIGWFADARLGLERFADAVAAAHAIKLRPKTAVYCSWYAEGKGNGGAGTDASTRELARFVAESGLRDHGLGVIQIDDRWQDGPQIQGPATCFDRVNPTGPYPDGIAPVAAEVARHGLVFGLWWLPFGRNHMQPEFADRQDWFFKWPDGKPLRQKGFGGTCLDSSHPEVQRHLADLGRTIRSWGVEYYKMDGLNVGSGVDHCYINDGYKEDGFGKSLPPHDPALTQIEVMRKGLKIIREASGDEVFFSGCCANQNMRTYAGSIGLVDSMRVGPDFNHDGEGIRSGPLRGSWVYFLNGRVWWNDPDPTKLRTSDEPCDADNSARGAVSLEQARLTTSWVCLTNQFFLISDWLPSLPDERIAILKRTMAPHRGTARPVDYFDHRLPNTWLVTDTTGGVRRDVIGLFNFYGEPLEIAHSLEKAGLEAGKTYHAFDYWADKLLPDINGEIRDRLAPNSCRVIALRAAVGRPVLLSVSSHVSQGMTNVTDERWDETSLSGTLDIRTDASTELRIRVPDGWQMAEAKASRKEPGDGSVSAAATAGGGLVRMTVSADAGGPVEWSVRFVRAAN